MRVWMGGVFLVVFAAWCAWAADKPSDKPNADEQAIKAVIDSYVAAFNRGDAKGVAAHWSESAEWVSPSGDRVQGRAAIEKAMAAMFESSKGIQLSLAETKVRLVTPDVALEEGLALTSAPGESPDGSTYIAIHVKRGDKWQLDSVRETSLPVASDESENQLDQLGWLVGEWVNSEADSTVETNVAWTKNGAFLSYSFRVATSEGDDLEGTQVIGWDPVAKVIRSWLFDSDGGFGQGVWRPQGDRWVVQVTQTLPDGRQASATTSYSAIDENSFQWESTARSVEGEELPKIGPVKVLRAKAEAKKGGDRKSAETKPAEAKPDEVKPADRPKPAETSKPAGPRAKRKP